MRLLQPVCFRNRRGFTVVEILVVMAIAAVLVSLIIVSWSQMLKSADSTRCLHNLRTLATAGRLYANEHDGNFTHRRFMHSVNDENDEPGLLEYAGIDKRTVGIDTVFTCPALQREYPTKRYAQNRNYVINRFATIEYPNKKRLYKKFTGVSQPSAMAYLMDGYYESQDADGGYVYSTHIVGETTGGLLYPHKGLNHVVFLDGHVEALTREEITGKAADAPFWTGGEP